ncbi:alpha/beta hydrolase [Bacillus bingmayongensis]|uniref:alpha/beta hydrolase n=1 Tax=Bacillus bingmayongensis TaxID=1150157 RepID=UPI001C8E52C0|nr:alpha/beta hydrolase family protein [Bacillus bingmayongensis]MBY0598966.1 alpha/beta hydrolase family protein [Bacillus bingmayongensis]
MEDANLIISKLIDRYALYDLHKKRSKEFQYSSLSNTSLNLKDIYSFYKVKPVDVHFDIKYSKDKEYVIGQFKYQSSVQSGDPRNNAVTGEVFLNNNDVAPHVILVHGWRMDSTDRIKNIFKKKMMDLGWNMYYFTMPYHFDREPESSLYSGEYMVSANIERTVQASRQAVVDLRALIHWIKANRSGRIILIGISLGGFITNLTALVEPKIDVLASIFYANRLSYSIWNTNPGKFIRKDLEHHGVTYDDLINYWKITEPSQTVPKIKKENILLISGKHDLYVHSEDTDYLWESWERPMRYIYNCGHAGIVLKRKKIATDTINFIRKRIEG